MSLEKFTDSLSLFYISTKEPNPTEKKNLFLGNKQFKNAHKSEDIDAKFFIQSEGNLAGALIKSKVNSVLLNTIESRRLNHPVEPLKKRISLILTVEENREWKI